MYGDDARPTIQPANDEVRYLMLTGSLIFVVSCCCVRILIHALWGACQVRFWNVFGLYISVDGADALGLALGGGRGVYERLSGLNVLLAGANGLRSRP